MKHERPWEELIESAREEALQRVRDDRQGAREDVAEILELVEERLFRADFDVSALRRACAPTAATQRRFRDRCGGSFKTYLIARRLEAAEKLVGETGVPMPEIAAGLGFADADLFRRWFKSWTGDTPEQRRGASRRGVAEGHSRSAQALQLPPISVWFRARAVVLEHEEVLRLIRFVRDTCTRATRGRRGGHRD